MRHYKKYTMTDIEYIWLQWRYYTRKAGTSLPDTRSKTIYQLIIYWLMR